MELSKFDVIQTFYVDSEAAGGSSEIFLTSIEVFFKRKPTNSAVYKPGVTLSICDVENDRPLLDKVYSESLSRVEFDDIYDFSDASVSTSFIFSRPIILQTNRFYGFVIQFDDVGFELWVNKEGDRILGTNNPSPGINSAKDGSYFNAAVNPKDIKPLSNIDLKYKINVAKFTANSMTIELVNKDYEFISTNNPSGNFIGGENVYKLGANGTGTINVSIGNSFITGTGVNFSSLHTGDKVVVFANTAEPGKFIEVGSVVNNTTFVSTTSPLFNANAANYIVDVVAKVYDFNPVDRTMVLYESSANTSNRLQSNDVIVGSFSGARATITSVDNFSVDRVVPMIGLKLPSSATYNGTYNFSWSNGSAYVVDSKNERTLFPGDINEVSKYGGVVISRSNEVTNSFLYDNVARKSAITKIDFNVNTPTDKMFSSPYIDGEEIDFFIQQSEINDTSIALRNGIPYDTEVDKNGNALSKHIAKKITFTNNRFAEDVRVYADIYRPPETDVKIYCKLHNSNDADAFDDKQWTPLVITENAGRFSSTENQEDYIEYTFSLPKYPETANTVPGTFKVESGNTVVVGSGVAVNTHILPGDVVRVYNPLAEDENYFVTGVIASNTSTLTINTPTANASVLGSGFKIDKVKYKHIAFNDPQNDNVCTYFSEELSQISTFDTMQVKVVFLANNTYYIPRVNRLSVIGVSA